MTTEQAAEQAYPTHGYIGNDVKVIKSFQQAFVAGWNACNEQALTEQHTAYLAGIKAAEKPSDVDTSKVTRLEVIGNGREYVNMNTGKVELSFQDDNRTLKVFIEKGRRANPSDAVEFVQWMTPKYYLGNNGGILINGNDKRTIVYSDLYAQFLTEKQKNNERVS